MFASYLDSRSVSRTFLTAEPTDELVGRLIRKILHGEISHPLGRETMACLFFADRSLHLAEIEPILKCGRNVVCDRYAYSTLAYQVLSFSQDDVEDRANADFHEWLWATTRYFRHPDYTFILDVDADEGLSRVGCRGTSPETYDRTDLLLSTRTRYLSIAARIVHELEVYGKVFVVDSSRDKNEVFSNIIELFKADQAKQLQTFAEGKN